jgi:hypothetical protein
MEDVGGVPQPCNYQAVASLSGAFWLAARLPAGFPLLLFQQCLMMTVSVFLLLMAVVI